MNHDMIPDGIAPEQILDVLPTESVRLAIAVTMGAVDGLPEGWTWVIRQATIGLEFGDTDYAIATPLGSGAWNVAVRHQHTVFTAFTDHTAPTIAEALTEACRSYHDALIAGGHHPRPWAAATLPVAAGTVG